MSEDKSFSELLKKCPSFQSLSLQHKKFILEYVKDFNGTRSAINAGFSEHTAAEQASRLLTKVKIQEALGEVTREIFQGDIASVEELREFWTKVARGNVTDIMGFNEDGMTFVKRSDELDPNVSRLIKKIKVTTRASAKGDWTESETNFEILDPLKASELLGKSLGIFIDKSETKIAGEVTINVKGRK